MRMYTYDDIITEKDLLTWRTEGCEIIGRVGWFFALIPDDLLPRTIDSLGMKGRLEAVDLSCRDIFVASNAYGDKSRWMYFMPEKGSDEAQGPEAIGPLFDISKERDRAALRGRWLRSSGGDSETMIIGFNHSAANRWTVVIGVPGHPYAVSYPDLVTSWKFIDGAPLPWPGAPDNRQDAMKED